MPDFRGGADARARRVVAAMYGRDNAARALGVELLEVRVGYARVAFSVRDDMLNGHGSCHGAFIFALADSAFAYACNGRNQVNVALQCSISFVAPSPVGSRLEASAIERSAGGRTGTYDVDVVGPDGTTVAYFRGTSYRVNAKVVADLDEPC
jgi:acyl-CoA thioesterase